MLKSKFLFAFFVFCLMAPLILAASCGKQQVPETKVDIIGTTPEQLERLETFDTQLSNIKDEGTAKTAITTFADYVEGPASSGAAASSVRIFSTSRIDQLAKLEAKGRQKLAKGGVSASSVGTEEGLTTIEKVSETLNLVKDSSIPDISPDEVQSIQNAVRSELPNIYPKSSPLAEGDSPQTLSAEEGNIPEPQPAPPTNVITPIEAMVIGYVLVSGDNGSAGPGAYKDKLPPEKVETFLNGALQ